MELNPEDGLIGLDSLGFLGKWAIKGEDTNLEDGCFFSQEIPKTSRKISALFFLRDTLFFFPRFFAPETGSSPRFRKEGSKGERG